MRKYLSIVLIFIFASVIIYSKPIEIGSKNAENKILIAKEKTRFKDALIDEMVKLLKSNNVYIKIVDHSKDELSEENPADYSAVFITNSGVKSVVRPKVMDWLNKYKNKNIILHTTQREKWTVKVNVDSVTSASSMSDVKIFAKEFVSKIKNLF